MRAISDNDDFTGRLKVTVAKGSEANDLLQFPVGMFKTEVVLPGGERQEVPKRFALYRTDTNEFLGSMSDRYKMFHHIDAKREVDKTLYESGVNFESTTRLIGAGERVHIDYTFPDFNASIGDDSDKINFLMRLQNSYDGRKQLGFELGAVRYACTNGMVTFKEGALKSKNRHMSTLDMGRILASLKEGISRFEGQLVPFYRDLSAKPIQTEQGLEIIEDFVDNKKIIGKRYKKHIQDRWTQPVRNLDKNRTAWVLYNSFTDVVTHVIGEKSVERSYDIGEKVSNAFKQLVTA